jgi:hypothetical protein
MRHLLLGATCLSGCASVEGELTDLSFFQVVEVPVLTADGEIIGADYRSAPLVADRGALLRARVELSDDAVSPSLQIELAGTVYESTDAASSSDGLSVEIPASALSPGAAYVARVMVDGDELARFPAEGEALLGALETGPLSIRFVPFEVNWNNCFYGLITGVGSRDEYEGITGTSESGGGEQVRACFAAGAAFAEQRSEDTLIYELGHVHGLLHAPCDGEDLLDPDYPYDGGVTGVEGYDVRTGSFLGADTKDMMTCCCPRWISDHNYAKLVEHVVTAQPFEGYQ